MNMQEFTQLLGMLDSSGKVLFNRADLFVYDRKNRTYFTFNNLLRSDYEIIGDILVDIKDIKLEKFIHSSNGMTSISATGRIEMNGIDAYIKIAKAFDTITAIKNKKSDIKVVFKDKDKYERTNVPPRGITDEVQYSFILRFPDREKSEMNDVHLGYACFDAYTDAISGSENIKIIFKEEF